jgi:hypothetical protein
MMTRQEALLTAVSVVITLVAGEIAARLLLRRPVRLSDRRNGAPAVPVHVADPELGWKIPAGNAVYRFHTTGAKGSVDVHYSIQDGHRATAAQPVQGPLLIAAGCSFTFGLGLDDQDTWPWLLQERLPEYHVINTGTNGYGTDQALMAADRAALESKEPVPLVVLWFGDFHIERNRSTQGMIFFPYPMGKPLFVEDGQGIKSRGLVRFWYPGSLLEHSALVMAVANRMGNVMNQVPSHDGAREVTVRLIREYAKRFAARGTQLAVVMVPHGGDTIPQSKADRRFMEERLRAAGIPVLIPQFPRMSDGRLDEERFLIPSDRTHPNGEYNRLVVDQMTAFLKEARLARLR